MSREELDAALNTPPSGVLRWRPFRLPLRHRFEAASAPLDDREGVLLCLEDAGGLRGWGEASPLASFGGGTVADVLALLETHGTALAGGAPAASLAGPGASALRCGLESARLDLAARRRGLPLAALLATGSHPPSVEVNAVVGSGSPEETMALAAEALDAGYEVLKLKAGVERPEVDVARLRAVREQAPEATLRLDANGAWSEDGALFVLRALTGDRLALAEQPVAADDVAALRRVARASAVPVAADEALASREMAERVLAERAATVLVLKPTVLGGVARTLALAEQGREAGMSSFVTATFGSSIEVALALHLAAVLDAEAASRRHVPLAHGLSTAEHLAADLVATPLLPVEGRLALPEGPGLGAEPDMALLDAHATGPWREARSAAQA